LAFARIADEGEEETRVRSTVRGTTTFTETPQGYTLNTVVGESQAAVERESSAVMTATQLLLVSCSFDHERAAMRTDIRQRIDTVVLVTSQQ
jgi:hypothetical protein